MASLHSHATDLVTAAAYAAYDQTVFDEHSNLTFGVGSDIHIACAMDHHDRVKDPLAGTMTVDTAVEAADKAEGLHRRLRGRSRERLTDKLRLWMTLDMKAGQGKLH